MKTASASSAVTTASRITDPFSRDVWDPFRDLQLSSSAGSEVSQFTAARIDWKEMPEAHVFKADVPGLKKEEKNDTWHRVERSSGKFRRRFRLPENAKLDQIKASMENGVLTVTVPMEEVKKPQKDLSYL